MWGLPIAILLTSVLTVALWNLQNWARKMMGVLYILAIVSGIFSLFTGGANLNLLVQTVVAAVILNTLNRRDVKYACEE